jgi:predicted RecB family endonuclease
MSSRIEPVLAFCEAMAALPQTREVWRALGTLIECLQERPEEADVLPDTTARVIYTWDPVTHRGLRLFYSIDGTVIRLLHVEEWDELMGDD